MTVQKRGERDSSKNSRDPDFAGAEIALRRAAEIARRRAIETSGAVAVFRNGKVVWEKADGTFDDEATSSRPVSSGIEIDDD